jgi:predicted NBD/HSP70 family sugar kinase
MIIKAAKEHPKSLLAKLTGGKELGLSILSEAAAHKDETALALWREIGSYLARGIASATLLLNPEAIVLAGGVSQGAKYFTKGIINIFKKQSIKTPFQNLKLLVSRKVDVGAEGAALYALSKFNEK